MKKGGIAIAVLVMVAGATLGHLSQRRADEVRRHHVLDSKYHYMPSPKAMKVAAMGMDAQVADLLWFRTVLGFSDRLGEQDEAWGEWLYRMLAAVAELDPQWRTPYFYGGSLLRSVNAYEASTKLFLKGNENLPDDPYFPFSAGMNYYLHHDDPFEAAKLLKVAATMPGAPDWYERAASGIIVDGTDREIAREYLSKELEHTTEPQLRAHLEDQINRLDHDAVSEQLGEARAQYERRMEAPLRSLEQLEEAFQRALPPDPMGGSWGMDPKGDIVSTVIADERREDAEKQERRTLSHKAVPLLPLLPVQPGG